MSRFSCAMSRLHICATGSFFVGVCLDLEFSWFISVVSRCFVCLHFFCLCAYVWILKYNSPDISLVSALQISVNGVQFSPSCSFFTDLVGGWFTPENKGHCETCRKREQIKRKLRASEDNHLVWKWLLWKQCLSFLASGPFGVAHFCVTVGTN